MPKYTSAEELQKQLEIDYLESGEHALLIRLLDAAESRIEKEINQTLAEFVDYDGELDSALVAAIYIFAATLHGNREAVAYATTTPVPYSFHFLLQPFRKYT